MTSNQLKYWELRWKQHYDSIFLKLKEQEIAQAWAELNEKIRHNKKSERQEQQRIIHERQKIELDWAKLNEQQRATLVSELFTDRKMQNEEKWTNAQINNLLEQQKVAVADTYDSYLYHKNQTAQKWFEAEAKLLDAGWGKAAVGELVADVKKRETDREYDKFMQNMAANLGSWFKEVYGPDASYRGEKWARQQQSNVDTDISNVVNQPADTRKPLKQMTNAEAQADIINRINKTGPHVPSSSGSVTGFSSTQDGSSTGTRVVTGTATSRTASSNPRTSGSKVIDSRGSGTRVVGPGVM